jgi:hypothetical protein
MIAAAATCLASQAFAQADGLDPDDLARIDTNGDGSVTREEFDVFAATAFQMMDDNSDRSLSPAEAGPDVTGAAFAAMDTDGDGAVSRQEFGRQMTADFGAADRDGNGIID